MIVFKLCTGQLLHIISSKEREMDPLKVTVRLEQLDPVQLSDFVHEEAVRWKRGEISVFIELLGLLLRQLRSSSILIEEDLKENDSALEDTEYEDHVDLNEDFEEDADEDYVPADHQEDEDYHPVVAKPLKNSPQSKPRKKRTKKRKKSEIDELDDVDMEHIKLEPYFVKPEDGDETVEERVPRCPDCSLEFEDESELRNHFEDKHIDEVDKFRCHLCGLSFQKAYNVRSHINAVHRLKRDFKCTECEFQSSRRTHVRRHLIQLHGILPENADDKYRENEKKCEICDAAFDKQQDYKLHIRTVHHDIKKFKCKLCSLEFENKVEAEDHLTNFHGHKFSDEFLSIRSDDILSLKKYKNPSDRVTCDQCDLTFCSKNSLKTHKRSVHDNIKDYSCKLCSSEFTTVSGVKRHIQFHHDVIPTKEDYENRSRDQKQSSENSQCSLCNLDLESVEGLVDHIVSCHPTQPHLFPRAVQTHGPLPWTRAHAWERPDWACPLCPQHMVFRTETLNGMVSHVKLGHPNSIMCWVCGMGWTNQEGKLVYQHMRECHPLKSLFACEKCGVYNQSKKLLSNHKKIHRMEELQGPMLSCELCDYVTPRPDILAKHRFSHRSSKNYMCDDCGKVLKSRTALATHAKLHADDKRNQCTICFKVFSQRGYLKTHMNSHSDSKPYSCEFCAMTFFGPTNLSQHRKRTHGDLIGESPKLACDLCPKRFWIPSELKYHRERVHEGKKDFSCGECQKRFADKKNLKKHLFNVHKLRIPHFDTM